MNPTLLHQIQQRITRSVSAMQMKSQSKSHSLQTRPFSSICSHPTGWTLMIWLLWRQVWTTIILFSVYEFWNADYDVYDEMSTNNVVQGTCKFFRSPANFQPDAALSLPEVAALDTCCQKAMFKSMKHEEKEKLKQRCGGSWKLVLGTQRCWSVRGTTAVRNLRLLLDQDTALLSQQRGMCTHSAQTARDS